MNKRFHLSFLLDKNGYNRIDLATFNSLSKLDEYTKQFDGSEKVRKLFENQIAEFCLDNMKTIKAENERNNRDWTGSIVIICDETTVSDNTPRIYRIGVIYKNSRRLLPKENCLDIIKTTLKSNPEKMLEIFNRKSEILSENEIDLIRSYQKSHNRKELERAVGFFWSRIKRYDDELLYVYCRALMNIFRLNVSTTDVKFGNVEQGSTPVNTMLDAKNKPVDPYLMQLIQRGDYEELYRVYGLDQIARDSDMFDPTGDSLIEPAPRDEDVIYVGDDQQGKRGRK